MSKEKTFVGFTDTGQPLVIAAGSCEYFQPGCSRLIKNSTCWYCRYADFRKTADIELAQSVCRCPKNHVNILSGCKNEDLDLIKFIGGGHHAL